MKGAADADTGDWGARVSVVESCSSLSGKRYKS